MASWTGAVGGVRGSGERRAVVTKRAEAVHGEYVTAARKLDHEHSLQPDGTPYPEPDEQRRRGLDGPVLLALRSYAPVQGLVVGSWQGASEAVHALARETADAHVEGRWG